MDQLEIHVELCEDMSFDTISSVETLAKTIKIRYNRYWEYPLTIKLVEPKSITRFEGKRKRVIDKRKENL